jgi:hypothetical protein
MENLRPRQPPAWREVPNLYNARERAALGWAEAVTRLTNQEVSDEVYNQARAEFSEKQLAQLTLSIVAINGVEPAQCRLPHACWQLQVRDQAIRGLGVLVMSGHPINRTMSALPPNRGAKRKVR